MTPLKPGFRAFLAKVVVFVLCFILISLLVGGTIVPGPLLYGLHFWVYGGLGYILLAMMLFFVIYARRRLLLLKKAAWGHWSLGVLSAALVAVFYVTAQHVQRAPDLAGSQFWQYFLLLHAVFLAMFVLLGFAVFGWRFVQDFVLDFRKELLMCLGIGVVFYALMQLVWRSWELLSFGVSQLVYWMLLLFPGHAILEAPRTIVVGQFAVEIAEACSGVFSIFLFTCLYLLIIALDWKQLKGWKVAVLFPIAVLGFYLANVLRVYLIILVGAFISPTFAVTLFHSYIGTILFLVFFLGFQWLTYDWMKQ